MHCFVGLKHKEILKMQAAMVICTIYMYGAKQLLPTCIWLNSLDSRLYKLNHLPISLHCDTKHRMSITPNVQYPCINDASHIDCVGFPNENV